MQHKRSSSLPDDYQLPSADTTTTTSDKAQARPSPEQPLPSYSCHCQPRTSAHTQTDVPPTEQWLCPQCRQAREPRCTCCGTKEARRQQSLQGEGPWVPTPQPEYRAGRRGPQAAGPPGEGQGRDEACGPSKDPEGLCVCPQRACQPANTQEVSSSPKDSVVKVGGAVVGGSE